MRGAANDSIILDEFYSWYCYHEDPAMLGKSLSGAEYVGDVNEDSVVIIDGLTKGFRLPGWRVCWVVGPKNLISAISQSGSFLDGGASHPMQVMALPLLEPKRVMQDKIALQTHFREKRDHVLSRLRSLGLPVKIIPRATFYIWVDLSPLPEPLNNGLTFFEELLKEKVICVPGLFFDVNPAKRVSGGRDDALTHSATSSTALVTISSACRLARLWMSSTAGSMALSALSSATCSRSTASASTPNRPPASTSQALINTTTFETDCKTPLKQTPPLRYPRI